MPKVAKALSALEVKRLAGAGLHFVGTVAGLGLNISDTGSRSWILRCWRRFNVDRATRSRM